MKRTIRTFAGAAICTIALATTASAGSYHSYKSLNAQVGYGQYHGGYRDYRGYRERRHHGFRGRLGFRKHRHIDRGPRLIERGGHRRGYTKFCSDHVRWSGHVGVRRCVLVRNDLLGRYRARYH